MAGGPLTLVLNHIRHLARAHHPTGDDARLLERFAESHDEEAFADLVQRYGPLVWRTCRRVLGNAQDAEDAFQATFLVLARKAGSVRRRKSLAAWLYGVALNVARTARRQGARRREREKEARDMAAVGSAAGQGWRNALPVLDEALEGLPERYRLPLVLCYLQGKTHAEAAGELRCPVGSMSRRLARGRELLRERLTARGVSLPAGALALLLAEQTGSATVPLSLVVPTVQAALVFAAGKAVTGLAGQAAVLAEAALQATATAKLKAGLAVLLSAALAVGGTSLLARQAPAARELPLPPAENRSTYGTPSQARTDPDGDSLPAGAARIGTGQFRHTGWHSRAFFTDGGNSLLVVGEGVVVRWWDVGTGKKLHEIMLKGGHHDAAFAPDADLLAVAGTHQPDGENGKSEHVLWLIDAAARKLVRTVGLPSQIGGNDQKVRVSADGKRVFVEYEGDVQVIDGKTGDELIRHKGRINAGTLAVSRDGSLVAFGRYDVFLWRWETGEEPQKFTAVGHAGTELMQFSPDGKTLYILPHGEVLAAWDVATGRQTGSRPLRTMTNHFAFSPDGKTLAIASRSGTSKPPEGGHAIDLLDTATWKEIGRLPLGRDGVEHVQWSKDGSRLAGVSDYRAWAWDVKTGKALSRTRPGHEGLISGMAFGPDGTLFTASDDHTIRSWDPATGAPGLTLVHDHWVRDLAVSPDGALVVGSALRNDLRVWDTKTGKPRFKLLGNGSMGGRRRVRFTPDGKHLVAWGDDEFVRVWEVRNGKLLSEHSTRPPGKESDADDPFADELRFRGTAFDAVDISADGGALALSTGKVIRVLDPMTGKERQTLAAGDNWPYALAFSPDAKRIAVAYRGKPVQTKLPDGRTQHSTAKEYPVTVWELASGKPLWTATAEGNWPRLAYSKDGSRVASVSNVGQGPSRVWVWDAATGKEAGRIELPRRGHNVAFDGTGKRLVVSLDDTTALVYDLETALKGPE